MDLRLWVRSQDSKGCAPGWHPSRAAQPSPYPPCAQPSAPPPLTTDHQPPRSPLQLHRACTGPPRTSRALQNCRTASKARRVHVNTTFCFSVHWTAPLQTEAVGARKPSSIKLGSRRGAERSHGPAPWPLAPGQGPWPPAPRAERGVVRLIAALALAARASPGVDPLKMAALATAARGVMPARGVVLLPARGVMPARGVVLLPARGVMLPHEPRGVVPLGVVLLGARPRTLKLSFKLGSRLEVPACVASPAPRPNAPEAWKLDT